MGALRTDDRIGLICLGKPDRCDDIGIRTLPAFYVKSLLKKDKRRVFAEIMQTLRSIYKTESATSFSEFDRRRFSCQNFFNHLRDATAYLPATLTPGIGAAKLPVRHAIMVAIFDE